MRWIFHIVTVLALVGFLVGNEQAAAGHVTSSDCPNEQQLQADFSVLFIVDAPSDRQSGSDDFSDLAKVSHCFYCWAQLPQPVALTQPHALSLKRDLSHTRGESLPPIGIQRPPIDLFV